MKTLPCSAEDLLPHRKTMLLIDLLEQFEDSRATASAKINEANIFLDSNGKIIPEYYIEVIAQTAAAASGFTALNRNLPVKNGYLVGIETFSVLEQGINFDLLRIKTNIDMQLGQMQVIDGEVFHGSTCIARARLKLWQDEEQN